MSVVTFSLLLSTIERVAVLHSGAARGGEVMPPRGSEQMSVLNLKKIDFLG
jgi:hypothetical protein